MQVCNNFDRLAKGGGQNRKDKGGGRYPGETARLVKQHILSVAPQLFLPVEDCEPRYQSMPLISQLSCSICSLVLNQPVELACGSTVCAGCCLQWIKSTKLPGIPCPCCCDDELNSSTVKPPAPLLISLLSDLLLTCYKCGKPVKAGKYTKHTESKCELFSEPTVNSPSRVTLKDVLTKPLSTPATPMERRVTEHLVRRLLDESPEERVIRVPG